jgi:hypothetical protein
VENRYAEARPNAAAIIAACWSGGAIKTSFFRGLTGEVPGRSAECRLADVRPFPRGVKRPQDEQSTSLLERDTPPCESGILGDIFSTERKVRKDAAR